MVATRPMMSRQRIGRCWTRSRRALLMTLTEDRAIAAAAITGDSSRPKAEVQDAGGDRYAGNVVHEGEHEVLPDVRYGRSGQLSGPDDAG